MADEVSGSRLSRLARLGWLSRRALPIAWRRLREATDAAPADRPRLAAEILDKHADIAEKASPTCR